MGKRNFRNAGAEEDRKPGSPTGFMATPQKLWHIFAPRRAMDVSVRLFGGVLAAAAQTTEVFIVYPFISVMMDLGLVHENHWLSWIYRTSSYRARLPGNLPVR
jgi:hypothetical protein